jgi:hypothetical protein
MSGTTLEARGQAQAVDVAFAHYAAVSAKREEDQKPERRRAG